VAQVAAKVQVAARAQVGARAQQAQAAKDTDVCESIETVAEYTTRAAAGERKWVAVAVAGGAGGVREEVADVCENFKTVAKYKARAAEAEAVAAEAERKLAAMAAEAQRARAAVAESSECAVCMGQKNHVLIPCGHLCVCEHCAGSIMASSQQCPVCRSAVVQILKVYS